MSVFDMANFSKSIGGENNLYLVDHENSEGLIREYIESIEKADKLCEVKL